MTSILSYLGEVAPFYRRASQTPRPLQPDLMDASHPAKPGPLHPHGQQSPRNWSSNEAFHPIGCFRHINLPGLLTARTDRCLSPPLDPTFLPECYFCAAWVILMWEIRIFAANMSTNYIHTLKTRIKPKERKCEKFSFLPLVTFGRGQLLCPPPLGVVVDF